MASTLALRERLRTSLWFVPTLFAVGAVLLAVGLLALDHALAGSAPSILFAFGGTAAGARSVLSTIAQSMLTFTGLVFSITMLVLQLASSQLSPRVTRTFLRDRANQVVLGLFVATFVFTLVVLREVRTPVGADAGFVPAVSVWVAFALLLASVGAFIYYIDHMAHAIRASTVIESIWRETAAAIDRRLPMADAQNAHAGRPSPDRVRGEGHLVLEAPSAGYLVSLDEEAIGAAVEGDGRFVELVPTIGAFVPEGGPLARLRGDWSGDAADEVRQAIGIGQERTLEQDVAFGFRQLVDIAVRALSPGINDPTTAVQALDRIHDLLRRLVHRRFPPERRVTDRAMRLVVSRPAWPDFVRLALDEIRIAGEGQLQVARRLDGVLADLLEVAPADRKSALLAQRAALDASVARSFPDAHDRAYVREVAEAAAAGR
ncbi:MAG TPA: DUF2254 domain-containing protein [Candidatus Limnocylindrales bacterium]|nr:DUF2254 domain-containing protein [Candidatus Limnocylindrales bacterium]